MVLQPEGASAFRFLVKLRQFYRWRARRAQRFPRAYGEKSLHN